MKLNQKDFKSILKYYKIKFDDYTKEKIQKTAEDVLATKMCRCIKKVNKKENINNLISNTKNNNESKAIAICTNSIFKKKQLNIFGVTCKKKYNLKRNKQNTHKLLKLKPQLKLYTNKTFRNPKTNKNNKTQKNII